MSRDVSRENWSPEILDEGYWASLLTEGEYSRSYAPNEEANNQSSVDVYQSPQSELSAPQEESSDWDEIQRLMGSDASLDLAVIGYNRGGLLVEWQSLRGFVPASQLVYFPNYEDENQRRQALNERVGEYLTLRVIELDRDKNRLILSERAAQVEAGTREQILQSVKRGDIVKGRITNLCDFGAFIDLGGVEGLIHISELSWGRVGHPTDLLERDSIIEAYVLEVAPHEARIALSLKRLHPDPWAEVERRYEIGQVVEGEITNVVDFGAFACIEEGLEGLIHFSELAEGHFLHPRNVVKEGEMVKARILSIDGKARRLGLSLRLV